MAGHEREAIPHSRSRPQSPARIPARSDHPGAARLALNRAAAEPSRPWTRRRTAKPDEPRSARHARRRPARCRRLDEARREYRKLADALTDDPRAWYGLGMTYQAIAERRLRPAAKDPTRRRPTSRRWSPTPACSAASFAAPSSSTTKRQTVAEPARHPRRAGRRLSQNRPCRLGRRGGRERDARSLRADCKTHPAECQFAGGHDLQILTQPHRGPRIARGLYLAGEGRQRARHAGVLPPRPAAALGRTAPACAPRSRAPRASIWNPSRSGARRSNLCPAIRACERELADLALHGARLPGGARRGRRAAEGRSDSRPSSTSSPATACCAWNSPRRRCPTSRRRSRPTPSCCAADASLGLALSRLGNHAEAVPHLEKALELDDDGSLYYQLGRAPIRPPARSAKRPPAPWQNIRRSSRRTEEQKEDVAREAQIGPPH